MMGAPHRTQRGVSLIELMIALLISLFLIGGAITVYVQARSSQTAASTTSQVQDSGRIAFEMMISDIRLAGLWGRNNVTGQVAGRRGSAAELAPFADDCEPRWYVDAAVHLGGSNEDNPYPATCIDNASFQAETDTLVVRHADVMTPLAIAELTATGVYIRSDSTHGELFVGNAVPAGFDASAQIYPFSTTMYYVRPYSLEGAGGVALDDTPSLRRISVTDGPDLIDEEIASGVEDFQVQFGVDTDGDGSVNSFLNGDSLALDPDQIMSVRMWLLLRATNEEDGYSNNNTYLYGGKSRVVNDGYRRVLLVNTVFLRNAQADS